MTFGENPFGDKDKKPKKGLSVLGFILLYLILWFYFASKIMPN